MSDSVGAPTSEEHKGCTLDADSVDQDRAPRVLDVFTGAPEEGKARQLCGTFNTPMSSYYM
ncbi:hypothetical protein PF004_g24107 [Phytophthora fragariae]|uniref:Uncharacterized protein n=1 Tax=Phytophthora fragariae TaxID=53985 RepID=A0A6G0MW44_9STRA|nr:hypothetical protein PF004_g24107 [Phytophthora fragariae]